MISWGQNKCNAHKNSMDSCEYKTLLKYIDKGLIWDLPQNNNQL